MPEAWGWDEELPKGIPHAPVSGSPPDSPPAGRRKRSAGRARASAIQNQTFPTSPDAPVLAGESFLHLEYNPD